MAEYEEAICQYWSFNPKLFSVLDKLQLHQKSTGESPAHMLVLELWLRVSENEEDDLRRLHLSFHNVSELKIQPPGCIQIPFLEITSIKDYQWENLKYRVHDAEGNQLSFYCNQFEVNVIEVGDLTSNS